MTSSVDSESGPPGDFSISKSEWRNRDESWIGDWIIVTWMLSPCDTTSLLKTIGKETLSNAPRSFLPPTIWIRAFKTYRKFIQDSSKEPNQISSPLIGYLNTV